MKRLRISVRMRQTLAMMRSSRNLRSQKNNRSRKKQFKSEFLTVIMSMFKRQNQISQSQDHVRMMNIEIESHEIRLHENETFDMKAF